MSTTRREAEAVARLLADERRRNARRVNVVRLLGVSAFFALFIVLAGVLRLREWQGNLWYFAAYWVVTAGLWATVRRPAAGRRLDRISGLSIAVIDVPMVFVLQLAQFPTSPNLGAIAGWNLGIYVFLIILAALSLDRWVVYATAATCAIFEASLQYAAGISLGAIIATLVVMALAGAACAYGSGRLVGLIARVARDVVELEVASRIQTSILPRALAQHAGFDIAAHMTTADEVGGDYYDVRAATDADGIWIGIGDVSGHGLSAGLIMLMVQTGVAALALDHDKPEHVIALVNRVVYDNVRHRLAGDDYVTCSVMRVHADGRLVIAGSHEPALVLRAATGACDTLDAPGTWLGVKPDIASATTALEDRLAPGDLLVLHTDGLTEARKRDAAKPNDRYGLPRLLEAVRAAKPDEPAQAICDRILAAHAAWAGTPDDDITLLVARYRGPS